MNSLGSIQAITTKVKSGVAKTSATLLAYLQAATASYTTTNSNISGTSNSVCYIMGCSSAGQYVYVGNTGSSNTMYYSSNYGQSFAKSTITNNSVNSVYPTFLQVDPTGQYVYYPNAYTFFSSNYGQNFGRIMTANNNAHGLAVKSNGTSGIVSNGVTNGLQLFSNSGGSVSSTGGVNGYYWCACSGNGTYLYITDQNNIYYYSSNGGSSYSTISGISGCVSCDISGQYVAIADGTKLYYSTNYGVTFNYFTTSNTNFSCVWASPSGWIYITACQNSTSTFVAIFDGTTWSSGTLTGSSNTQMARFAGSSTNGYLYTVDQNGTLNCFQFANP